MTVDLHTSTEMLLFFRLILYPLTAATVFFLATVRWRQQSVNPITKTMVVSHMLSALFFMVAFTNVVIRLVGAAYPIWYDTLSSLLLLSILVVAWVGIYLQRKVI